MTQSKRIVYYNGDRVFPDRVSNIGFTNNNLSLNTLLECKCGSIFKNIPASRFTHVRCAKHKRFFGNSIGLMESEMFQIYRL